MTLVPELFVRRLNKPKGLPINVRDVSVTGDGQTDDYAALNEAVRSAGATGTLYFPAGTYVVGTNLTLSCAVIFAFGATLEPDAGVTVTLSGPVTFAPSQPIVSSGAAGTVSITGPMSSGGGFTDLRALGAVADGVTDNTAFLVALIDTLSDTDVTVLLATPNILFDYTAVIAALAQKPNASIMDWSGVSSYNTGGLRSKTFGMVSGDIDTNDSSWSIQSGHHAVLEMNNYGVSESSPNVPTSSAAVRAMSVFYNTGEYEGEFAGAGNRGYRVAAQLLFAKSGAGDFWKWGLRKYSSWQAITANWERWTAGVPATSGVTIVYATNGSYYIAASTGLTGGTEPNWGSGTQSDGGVDWTYLFDSDAEVFSVDEHGRVKIGNGVSTAASFSQRQSETDTSGDNLLEFAPLGASKTTSLRLYATNGAAATVVTPIIRADTDGAIRVRNSTDTATLFDFSDAGGVSVNEFRFGFTLYSAADGDTTPSVAGLATLYVSNTGATSITALDDGSNDQVVRIIATNGNTTLVHSAGFALNGSANVTLTASSSITMQRLHSFIGSGWVEVSRSIV
jgi:hypothetical protein